MATRDKKPLPPGTKALFSTSDTRWDIWFDHGGLKVHPPLYRLQRWMALEERIVAS
jgi:hypothetical protein